jgi:G6PDH family F420-dependent oxidoreductase
MRRDHLPVPRSLRNAPSFVVGSRPGKGSIMVRHGLTLSSEEHPPSKLVEIAVAAEEAGFDFVSISDHYHPWIEAQGHSPFVWAMLGALSEATTDLEVGVGVTCPTVRIHPAVTAQAAATAACLLEGRFTWGVGSGEALNEHVLGDRWPPGGRAPRDARRGDRGGARVVGR